ncbi:MAG TPA: FAD-dependent thymidylate synthase [Phycisphaerales bacterium]|nr:FAD-dependent thymidylate synthase [Phycisphaerales bacterium]HMP35877.1 FAD-dependent thymidylate synthase [Phycisphaerales bacterium]
MTTTPASTSSFGSPRITRPEAPLVDVMGGALRVELPVHEHGFIALVDAMPRLVPEGQTADFAIVQAARVSYGEGTRKVNEDRGLVRYLMRHRHSTPFEMVEFKFHIAMPIFVARQWIRHRTANVNEYSARYSIVPDRFYRPNVEEIRRQSRTNRQGGEGPVDAGTAERFLALLDRAEAGYRDYSALTEEGLARELARAALPVSLYTEWYWKCDLHNIFHFLSLRMDPHAQKEIRDYADAMFELIRPIVPVACEAFVDYRLDGMHLTRLEVEALRSCAPLASENQRELAEWTEKRRRLGLEESRLPARSQPG